MGVVTLSGLSREPTHALTNPWFGETGCSCTDQPLIWGDWLLLHWPTFDWGDWLPLHWPIFDLGRLAALALTNLWLGRPAALALTNLWFGETACSCTDQSLIWETGCSCTDQSFVWGDWLLFVVWLQNHVWWSCHTPSILKAFDIVRETELFTQTSTQFYK